MKFSEALDLYLLDGQILSFGKDELYDALALEEVQEMEGAA